MSSFFHPSHRFAQVFWPKEAWTTDVERPVWICSGSQSLTRNILNHQASTWERVGADIFRWNGDSRIFLNIWAHPPFPIQWQEAHLGGNLRPGIQDHLIYWSRWSRALPAHYGLWIDWVCSRVCHAYGRRKRRIDWNEQRTSWNCCHFGSPRYGCHHKNRHGRDHSTSHTNRLKTPKNVLDETTKQLLKILKSHGCRKTPMFIDDMDAVVDASVA